MADYLALDGDRVDALRPHMSSRSSHPAATMTFPQAGQGLHDGLSPALVSQFATRRSRLPARKHKNLLRQSRFGNRSIPEHPARSPSRRRSPRS